jgi:hypothetical protein
MTRKQMHRKTRDVPEQVHQAAATAWRKWSEKLSTVPPAPHAAEANGGPKVDPDAGKTPEERMISKIKRRMKEYPEWYETDQEKVAVRVCTELERIGGILERELPESEDPVEVWQVPLSVFNWLVMGDTGEQFVHGALSAWSGAQSFNAANDRSLDSRQKARLREPFLEIAPPLLKAVLEQMLQADLWISFAQKFVGPELKSLVMRVQRPVEKKGA